MGYKVHGEGAGLGGKVIKQRIIIDTYCQNKHVSMYNVMHVSTCQVMMLTGFIPFCDGMHVGIVTNA